MKRLNILGKVLRLTNSDKILYSYLIFVFLDALFIWLVDPAIETYGNALWYCAAVISTCGFGDFAATTFITRLATVLLMVYSVVVVAVVTGVIVNFHSQLISIRNKETIDAFVHKLEHLPDMSKEELADIARKAKTFSRKGKE